MSSRLYHKLFIYGCMWLAAACSKSEPAQPETTGRTVSFGIENVQGRSAVMSADSILSLGVFGYSTNTDNFDPLNRSHTADLFYNRKATRIDGEEWSYGTPVVYWPIDLAIKNTFFAYAPHSSDFPVESAVMISGNSDWGNPTLTYATSTEVSRQVDILYSTPVQNINRTANNGKVLYTMRHAMAWVTILVAPVQKNNSNETYTLKSLHCTGKNFVSRGRLDLGTGIWTGLASASGTFNFRVNNTPVGVGTVARTTPEGDYLMVIPQQLTQANNEPMINLSFTFNDGTGEPQDDSEYFYSVPFPDTRLNAGNIVVYVIKISVDGVAVIFQTDNTIEKWIEDPSVNIVEVY